MSIPKFPQADSLLSREEAINAILSSIAMEEIALSHILEAESEKIKFATEQIKCNKDADIKTLLKINESAASLIGLINDMQLILKNKLRLATNYLPEAPCPQPKQPEPFIPCIAVFSANTEYCWSGKTNLRLETCYSCENGVEICSQSRDTPIILPAGKKYRVELDLELINLNLQPVFIEAKITCGHEVIFLKNYSFAAAERYITLFDLPIIKTQVQRKASKFLLNLQSPESLKVKKGTVLVSEVQ